MAEEQQGSGNPLSWVWNNVLRPGFKAIPYSAPTIFAIDQYGQSGRDQRSREELLLPGIQQWAQDQLNAPQPSSAIDRSQLPTVAVPDYSGIRGSVSAGYDQALGQMNDGFGAYQSGISSAYDQRLAGLGQMRDELGGMFNFGEDPYARALLDFTQGDIDARRNASQAGATAAYQGAVDSINAQAGNIDAAAQAAAIQQFYADAAAQASANNAGTAAAIGGAQGVTGVGPATGAAADAQDAIAATGAISADAARANAEAARNTLAYMAAAAQTSGAARGTEIGGLADAARAQAQRQFMADEAARIARERDQYRQAEMSLRNQELMLPGELAERLAEAGFANSREAAAMGLQQMEALTGLDMRDADARAAAENYFVGELGRAEIERQLSGGGGMLSLDDTRRTLEIASLGGEDEFATNAVGMLARPEIATQLYALGIVNESTAKEYYRKFLKNPGQRSGNSSGSF